MAGVSSRNYAALSLAEVEAEMSAVARDAQSTFGALDERQLNWRPDATSWSVAQCFDHLLNMNRLMFQAIDRAWDGSHPLAWWQRLPMMSRVFGALLIKSQSPDAKRKHTAPATATPSASAIDAGVVARFVASQSTAAARVRSLTGRDAASTIMVSPFAAFITYSVLDGCRLIVAHARRHFEQARRVTEQPGFPPPSVRLDS
jgi:hypothetical protein